MWGDMFNPDRFVAEEEEEEILNPESEENEKEVVTPNAVKIP